MFFTMPLPPPYNPSLPNTPGARQNERPSDSQFTTFLYSVISTLPEAIQALYNSAMHNLGAENTPELTGEMRASLTSALTGFALHVPTTEWWEEEGVGVFLTRLARGEVPGSELVVWADTITAALRAFSGAGGSPAPSRPSSSVVFSSRSPLPQN
ncbi:hypothetical protein DFP73DRAFT_108563 [Morchella snyderi]|nr:hypothetical protein DFP73DRAFT_108563 [Morchella snyderi]